MWRRLICALGALVMVTVGAAAGGVTEIGKDPPRTQIRFVMQGDKAIYELSGEIDPGAEEIFEKMVDGRQGGWLVLKSMGGNVAAAIAIGTLARSLKMNTYVTPNSYCLSACAMIWAGGYSRWVGRGGTLGFHAPWQRVSGRDIGASTLKPRLYYTELNYSAEAIRRFLTPHNTFYYLTESDAAELGIEAHWND